MSEESEAIDRLTEMVWKIGKHIGLIISLGMLALVIALGHVH